MSKYEPYSSNGGMLIIKIKQPYSKICQTIDMLNGVLSTYGSNYKIVNLGLAKKPMDSSRLDALTNLPWDIYVNEYNPLI